MNASTVLTPPMTLDYSLTGVNSTTAVERGLAEAEWYQSPVPRETLRDLLQRRDGPAIRDTILWFVLIFAAGFMTYALWGSWWAILPYAFYSVLYASTSDSRWHEAGHGTAFKTDWMNNALYEIASFMVMRQWALPPDGWITRACADLSRSGHVSDRGAQWSHLCQREPRWRGRRSRSRNVSVTRRQ
jgi:hypothetical protein